MRLSENVFKQNLSAGRAQYGLWLGIPNTTVAEICANAGFDWVVVDAEHGPFDIGSILQHLQTLAAYPVAPIVRLAEGNSVLIKQALDLGAQTLLLPMVDTAQQARDIVRAANYPPIGIRGMGTALARAARWNAIDDYANQANKEICIIVQIESTTALENLEAIVAVDGVDAAFIGPADLSASMGHVGNPAHPEVKSAIYTAIDTIVSAGKQAGILAVTPDLAAEYVDRGASFVGVGVDTALLGQATKELASRYLDSVDHGDVEGY